VKGAGRFCTSCGADLAGVAAPAPRGTTPAASDGGTGARLGWVVAAFLLVAIILVVVFPVLNQSTQPASPAAAAPGAGAPPLGAAPNVDLSSMTPREAAERLFNRVMTAVAAGNEAEARNFAPMAVAAYELAEPLDVSGTFDLSLLKAVNQDYQGALDTAEAALQQNPDHLFLLSAAGAAAGALGDRERAAGHYRRLLEVFDAQTALAVPEYAGRPGLLPQMRAEAEAFLSGGGA
jgi:tetratricopeptide (TPR) repeat protein